MVDKKEIIYDGFVTPSLILEGSNINNSGNIIDPYAKTEEQDGLLYGAWSIGMDKLIHIYLMKPVAVMCDERFGWVNKKVLLKEPIPSVTYTNTEGKISNKKSPTTKPKQKVVFDPVTKQFRLEM